MKMKHVYEVFTVDNGEDIVVDIMRFNSEFEAKEFESDIVGDFKIRPHTMSAEEMVDYLLDNIADLEEDLYLARSYINEINGGLKSRPKTMAKVHQFPTQKS